MLDRFQRTLESTPSDPTTAPEAVTLELVEAAERPAPWDVADTGLDASHFVIGALGDGRLVGRPLLSPDGPVYVHPLDRTV